MMRWALIVIGVLIGLLVLPVLIGALLPRAHHATRTVRYPHPPEIVYATIADFQGHPAWRTDLIAVERLADRDGRAVWKEVHRGGDQMTLVIESSEPPRRMVTRIVDNRMFGGSWTWEVVPADDGCALTITEDGEIYNPLFRFVARFFLGYHAAMDRLQAELAEHLARAQGGS